MYRRMQKLLSHFLMNQFWIFQSKRNGQLLASVNLLLVFFALCKTRGLTNFSHYFWVNFILVEWEKKCAGLYIHSFCYCRCILSMWCLRYVDQSWGVTETRQNKKFWLTYMEWSYCWNPWMNVLLAVYFSAPQTGCCFWSKTAASIASLFWKCSPCFFVAHLHKHRVLTHQTTFTLSTVEDSGNLHV